MKTRKTFTSICILLTVYLTFNVRKPALAQTLPPTILKAKVYNLPPIHIKDTLNIEFLEKMKPISYNPFLYKDLGKNVKSTTIMTLNNGKRISADKYLVQLNLCERKLNAKGYSIRTMASKLTVLSRSKETKLQQQQQQIDSKNKSFKNLGSAPVFPASLYLSQEAAAAENTHNRQIEKTLTGFLRSPAVNNECQDPSITFDTNWTIGSLGDPRYFEVGLNSSLNINGTLNIKSIRSGYKVTCHIFDKPYDLMAISTSLNIDTTGIAKTKYKCTVLGEEASEDNAVSTPIADAISKTFIQPIGFDWNLWGIISIGLTADLVATSSFIYTIEPGKSKVEVVYTPILDAQFHLRSEVNAIVIDASAGGDFTIINDAIPSQIEIYNSAESGNLTTSNLYVNAKYDVYNHMTALSGNIWAYVTIGIPYIYEYTFGGSLVDWDGITDAHTVFVGQKLSCAKQITHDIHFVQVPLSILSAGHNLNKYKK